MSIHLIVFCHFPMISRTFFVPLLHTGLEVHLWVKSAKILVPQIHTCGKTFVPTPAPATCHEPHYAQCAKKIVLTVQVQFNFKKSKKLKHHAYWITMMII